MTLTTTGYQCTLVPSSTMARLNVGRPRGWPGGLAMTSDLAMASGLESSARMREARAVGLGPPQAGCSWIPGRAGDP
jgi:hypothetical protein